MENLRSHLRPTLLLAFPVMLSQLGHVLVNFVDSVVVGHIGKVPLAAVGVGVSTTSVLLVLGIGLSMGAVPLVAAASGRRDLPELGRLLVASVWMSALAGLVLAGVGQLLPWLMQFLGQPPEVVALAGPWVQVISLSLFPLMVFQGFREFAAGLGLTRQAMWLSILANVINGLLCYALVYGSWGAPEMGMMGSAWATLIARGLMAALMAAYVLYASRLRAERAAVTSWLPAGATIRRAVGLGAPIGVQMALEVGAFGLSLLMAGWLGVTTEAAHKVAIDLASMTYMAASGIAAAATIRVGHLRGAGNMGATRQAGFAAYWLTFGFMGAMGLVMVMTRNIVPYVYITDPQVVAQASTLLLIAALFQVSDGLQVVGLGALRGLEDVKVPSVVALLAYWAVALPLGYFLGFKLHLGAPGVWIGLLVGLTIVAVVLLQRFRRESEPTSPATIAPATQETAAA
ncbi:MATE family efflux transporter [Hymenobacter sp. IS2118]|uniref:MATE family efflux transporter n=1 Tax=Hymenobacter sp. IS2118 TaxID=1505605 RepID=UPI000553828B|nr:MATE family efflux transporter [Hymenobacter sp. IS2118]